MHRLFVPPAWLQGSEVRLGPPVAHQISRVLRLRPGAHIVLLDNSGWAYEAEVERVTPAECLARVVARTQPQTEPRVRLWLYQALTREQKFDWVLQKGTELGVSAFVPLQAQRALIPARERPEARLPRWQRIVTEAAEQAGRARVPRVLPPQTVRVACESLPAGTLALLASLEAPTTPLGQVLRTATVGEEIRLLIGPEGDFTPEEVADAQRAGVVLVSLGPRILRTETAGLAALSAILYALGELG